MKQVNEAAFKCALAILVEMGCPKTQHVLVCGDVPMNCEECWLKALEANDEVLGTEDVK